MRLECGRSTPIASKAYCTRPEQSNESGPPAAQAGDLVAFYSPVSHIGIYLGNGQMVHAPTSGDVVKIASIDTMGATPKFNRVAA